MIHRREIQPYSGCLTNEIEVDGEKAIYLTNRSGYILTKTEFQEYVNFLNHFYEAEGVEDWIEKTNRIRYWTSSRIMRNTPIVEGKYMLPKPEIKEKTFRKNLKKDWSRKCEWCGHKFSSKDGGSYYTFWTQIFRHTYIEGMCCSEPCAENLWFDKVAEQVIEKELTDIFHTDKRVKPQI